LIKQTAVAVDTGPLVAVVDRSDRDHDRCKQALFDIPQSTQLLSVLPVLTEAFYLLSKTTAGHDTLFELLRTLHIELIDIHDAFKRIRELMNKYHDLPMDFADACLVAGTELHNVTTIMTLDSDFQLYRPVHAKHFKLLP
jgi:uncharacterized protein